MKGELLVAERKCDNALYIKTTGIREWDYGVDSYNRYEATPYTALDKLFKNYKLEETDKVVDFGSGRGRVAFYIHNHFQIPVTGVEANDKTFDEAVQNKKSYEYKLEHIEPPIHFEYGLAEHYKIEPEDNIFYFFNPFSIKIFKRVVMNILKSVKQSERTVELILYYPLPEFKQFLRESTPFEIINKIKVSGDHGKYGKFVIYRAF